MTRMLTIGQAAKFCKVAPRTVAKWFDSGRLKGYRIPGSQDRRISEPQLLSFMKEHGLPLPDALEHPDTIRLELSREQADILHFILRNVGGTSTGPRRHIDNILESFSPLDWKPVSLYSATKVLKPDPKLHSFYIEEKDDAEDSGLPS